MRERYPDSTLCTCFRFTVYPYRKDTVPLDAKAPLVLHRLCAGAHLLHAALRLFSLTRFLDWLRLVQSLNEFSKSCG